MSGPAPVSEASAAAIEASSNGLSDEALRLNSSWASTSSCGGSGTLERVIFGALAVPEMVSMAVTEPLVLLATKFRLGSVRLPPLKLTSPLVKVSVWPAMLKLPWRMVKLPSGCGFVLVPRRRSEPVSSAKIPRPAHEERAPRSR